MSKEIPKKVPWQNLLAMLLVLASAFALGFGLAVYASGIVVFTQAWQAIIFFPLLLLVLYAAAFVQIILHETGHLIFGLLTGYRFCSFRILQFIWTKSDGKIRFGRYSMAGTGGQCLLAPPDPENGRVPKEKFPTLLHNLGGVIMNLLSAPVFFVLFLLCRGIPLLSLVWLILAGFGLLYGILNGIPLRTSQISNDGANALELIRYPAARRALWIQLETVHQLAGGRPLRDMPEEWFTMPDGADMQSSLVTAIAVFSCNRLMDQQRFGEAGAQIGTLLSADTRMAGIHRNLLTCDLVYLECIGPNRPDRLDALLTPFLRRFMKSMKRSVSVLRTNYALALLHEQNPAKASLIRADFEKAARGYPYPVEVASERALLEAADRAAAGRTDRTDRTDRTEMPGSPNN